MGRSPKRDATQGISVTVEREFCLLSPKSHEVGLPHRRVPDYDVNALARLACRWETRWQELYSRYGYMRVLVLQGVVGGYMTLWCGLLSNRCYGGVSIAPLERDQY